jgi:large subunit ribosomal protein L32e
MAKSSDSVKDKSSTKAKKTEKKDTKAEEKKPVAIKPVAKKPTPAKKEAPKKPVEKKKIPAKKPEKKKKGEKVQIVEEEEEEGVYRVKAKPKLDKGTKRMINIKTDIDNRRPKFRRQEWFRYKRLGTKWRKPRGLHSKMRVNRKYRPKVVSIGFRSPKAVRDLHPSGFKEVLVYNPRDLKDLDPKTQAVRIGHSVGTKKREEIIKAADKKELRVLNRGGV